MEVQEISQIILSGHHKEGILLLEKYCLLNPKESYAKFILALLLSYNSVYVDGYLSSLDNLKSILKDNPNNINAVILIANIESENKGYISEDIFKRLTYSLNITRNKKDLSILNLLCALYWENIDKKQYYNFLLKSTELDEKASLNFYLLSSYLEKSDPEASAKLLKISYKNVTKIYSDQDLDNLNLLDFEEYKEERLRGVHLTEVNFYNQYKTLK